MSSRPKRSTVRGHERRRDPGRRDVSRHRERPELAGHGRGSRLVADVDRHLGAAFDQAERRGAPQPARRTGHQGDAAGEVRWGFG